MDWPHLWGAGQTLHLLWAPRWGSGKVDPLLAWLGCPGEEETRHTGSQAAGRPFPSDLPAAHLPPGHPFPTPRPACWPPTPSSIHDVCPGPHTFCVCSSPERIRASKSRAEGLGGSSGISLLPPSLHTQSGVCISGLCPPQHPAAWTHVCSETSLVSESAHSRPCTQPALCCSDSLGRGHKAPESLIPQGSGGWMSKAEEQAGSGPGENSPTDSTLILVGGSAHLSLERH